MSDESVISVQNAIKDLAEEPPRLLQLEEETFDERFQNRGYIAQREYTKLIGLQDHFRHKKCWSWFLMGLMGVMVLFQFVLIGLVGAKIWDFHEYNWLLPTLMIQYLIQIVGLAVFVVRSLFKELD